MADIESTGFVSCPVPRTVNDHGGFGTDKLVFHALRLGPCSDDVVFKFQIQEPIKGLSRTVGIERWGTRSVEQRTVVAGLEPKPPVGGFDWKGQTLDVLIGELLCGLKEVVLGP